MNSLKRTSNIEMGRIICMSLIIGHHITYHGGGVYDTIDRLFVSSFFLSIGKICFDTFICISMWFLVDSFFYAERFIKMYVQAICYSVLGLLFAWSLGGGVFSFGNLLSAFLPLTGNIHGYIATYLAFYLILPFLIPLDKLLTKYQHLYLVIILFIFMVITRVIGILGSSQSTYSRLGLFVFFFFAISFLKKYNVCKCLYNWRIMLFIFLGGWIVVSLFRSIPYIIWNGNIPWYMQAFGVLYADEGSIINIVGGTALFFFFLDIKVTNRRWINCFGSTTMAVLMLHDSNFFRPYIWRLLHVDQMWQSSFYFLYLFLIIVLVYVVCSLIDFAYKYVIERNLFRVGFVYQIANKWNHLLNHLR